MKFYKFTAVFEPEKGEDEVYNVSVPALLGCFSFGDSREEARYNIREAIELYLETFLEEGRPIPADKNKIRVPRGALKEEITVGVDFQVKSGFPAKALITHGR
ncbi:MAG TPA: type II toxin-antitoxin system HicB family antitoxin [Candidatus Paceibacterota bacterium]